jgi:hypothetical protein
VYGCAPTLDCGVECNSINLSKTQKRHYVFRRSGFSRESATFKTFSAKAAPTLRILKLIGLGLIGAEVNRNLLQNCAALGV